MKLNEQQDRLRLLADSVVDRVPAGFCLGRTDTSIEKPSGIQIAINHF